ncbi:MAG: DUF3775 domain-containing protein [Kiloniellaceae bacterium]
MLEIDPEIVYFLILKARAFDDKDEPGGIDPDAGRAEAVRHRTMRYVDGDPVAQEIDDTIAVLNEDQQAELVALAWLGRGDFTAEEWAEAVRTARERRTASTAEYLLGTPLLGDYLEEGLAQLGFAVEDLEPARA